MFIIIGLVRRFVFLVFWASLLVLIFAGKCANMDIYKNIKWFDSAPEITTDQQPLVDAVVARAADNYSVAAEQVKVKKVEPTFWTDTCMGVPRRSVSCDDKIVPGAKVTVEVQKQQLLFHVASSGEVILVP